LGIKVVAVTGSCGKTTTKELLASILAQSSSVIKTWGNYNNLIGVPLTLLQASPMDETAVVELGTNSPGEIGRLSEIAAPDVALITNIRPAHLKGFGSIEGVALEKNEIWNWLRDHGTAVINLDDPLIDPGDKVGRMVTFSMSNRKAHLFSSGFEPLPTGAKVRLSVMGSPLEAELHLIGRGNIENCLAAAAAATAAGADAEAIKPGLEKIEPVPGRLSPIPLSWCWLLDDSYNANPASMKEGLDVLKEWGSNSRKIAILGDMKELGHLSKEFHQEIGRYAASLGLDLLIAVGHEAIEMAAAATEEGMDETIIFRFQDTPSLEEWLLSSGNFERFEGADILIKGSRAMRLERIRDLFTEQEGC